MPVEIGKAGKSTRKMAKRRALRVCGCLLASLFLGSLLALLGGKYYLSAVFPIKLVGSVLGGSGLGLLIVILMYFGKWGREIDQTIDRAVKGAIAEERVSELLGSLPDDFFVFNDVLCPLGNIDHIVLGPTGIFIIETKSHNGRISLSDNGELLRNLEPFEKGILKQVLDQTFWLKEKMADQNSKTPFIQPIITFTRAFVEVRKPVKTVQIVNKNYLVRRITGNKSRLGKEDLQRIAATLSRLVE